MTKGASWVNEKRRGARRVARLTRRLRGQSWREGMSTNEFQEVVERICAANGRYQPAAYAFLRRGLDSTLHRLRKSGKIEGTAHISGPMLLDGLREYALEQYGPLARLVLEHWGVHSCRDFGEIVFELVDYGVLGKTEEDRIEDFEGGYDFAEAFEQPFEPRAVS